MSLYTTAGDNGETSLCDGTRLPKNHPRIQALGALDELNAVLGWCRSAAAVQAVARRIEAVQRELFILGAELATPPGLKRNRSAPMIEHEHCRQLEALIDEACQAAPPPKGFVLPGGTELASRLQLARTCCRSTERSVVALGQSSALRPEVIAYLNRLGDLLFAWARQVNHEAGCPDVLSVPPK